VNGLPRVSSTKQPNERVYAPHLSMVLFPAR
jgi:hypothetical protein